MVRRLLPGEGLHEEGSNSGPENRADRHHSDQDAPECVLGGAEVEHLNGRRVTFWLRAGSNVEK